MSSHPEKSWPDVRENILNQKGSGGVSVGDAVAVTSLVISGVCMCLRVNLRISQHLENPDVGYPDIHFSIQFSNFYSTESGKAIGHFMQNIFTLTSSVLSGQESLNMRGFLRLIPTLVFEKNMVLIYWFILRYYAQ